MIKESILNALNNHRYIPLDIDIFSDDLKSFKEILDVIAEDLTNSQFKNMIELNAYLYQNIEKDKWSDKQKKEIAISYSECMASHRKLAWNVYTGNLADELEYYVVLHGIETFADCYKDIIPIRFIFRYITKYLENNATPEMAKNLKLIAPDILDVVNDSNAFEEYLEYQKQTDQFMSAFRGDFIAAWHKLDTTKKIACLYLDYKTDTSDIDRLTKYYTDSSSQNFITSLKTRALFTNYDFDITEFTSIYQESKLDYIVDNKSELPTI